MQRMQVMFRTMPLLLLLGCFLLLVMAGTGQTESATEVSLDGVAPDQVDSVLATLSDEQVRSLLIAELGKEAVPRTESQSGSGGFLPFVISWLHVLDGADDEDIGKQLQRVRRHARVVPTELSWGMRRFSADSSLGSAWKNIGILILIFFGAFAVELIFRTMTGKVRRHFLEQAVPELDGIMRFWGSTLRVLPQVVHLFVFGGSSLLIFIVSSVGDLAPLRYLFMALLFVVFFIRIIAVLSQLFCSPGFPELRLLPVSDTAAGRLHGSILFLFSYTAAGLAFLALIRELGIQEETITLLSMALATALIFLIAFVVIINRKQVAGYIYSDHTGDADAGWIMQQFASSWHVLVLFYLFVVWLFMLLRQFSDNVEGNGAFLFSLFIVPGFLVLDRIAGWIVRSVIRSMRIYDTSAIEDSDNSEEEVETLKRKEQLIVLRTRRTARLGILLALGVWMLSLWGYNIPYAVSIINAVFDILVTLALALLFWRVASSYIERKIKEATPEEEEGEAQDDEWGAAATRGRGYTLLPMVRKFIGTVLVVMVTLIILSSIGVDIGPLLAGAGVIGLAIGFGAQKLVSDVFSGFFYLLDDAFRVGEYLQAGSVSGSVEAITLRNVMLRHHRGMLQIVPYSELGAITNFMRGGIVVKFNLEFPYDSDIDKIRKVIKKVGQAMLQDEEFGDDFIRPVKSQGVREITNSVMVIRVKFTANPGTHFVIRREAYRRITEALAAKGIHYAHRKVIVEVPHDETTGDSTAQSGPMTPEKKQQVAELGAAAGLAAMAEDEAKKATDKGGS